MNATPQILIDRIFESKQFDPALAMEVFGYQYAHSPVYRDWCKALHITPADIKQIHQIPFLPISFFKSREVIAGSFEPELIFESSGTTATGNSRHLVKEAAIYQRSFVETFKRFYGDPKDYCILGLLPNYLEKGNSSLVKMVHDLCQLSQHPDSGFYLYDFDQLGKLIIRLESQGQKTLLLGVTFALMDFADQFKALKDQIQCSANLHHTVIMDTGGMKGRKKEMTREEVHSYLCSRLGVHEIHSEYGMTELLSQAYSKGGGKYTCPPWMKVMIRDENDPLTVGEAAKGLINVIDLANIYSCSFIATDDVGWLQQTHFEVWGRRDHSDLRGCSLLIAGND